MHIFSYISLAVTMRHSPPSATQRAEPGEGAAPVDQTSIRGGVESQLHRHPVEKDRLITALGHCKQTKKYVLNILQLTPNDHNFDKTEKFNHIYFKSRNDGTLTCFLPNHYL